jgi:solute carrier family 25 carnitine/acylcarnitine transporter 20/29
VSLLRSWKPILGPARDDDAWISPHSGMSADFWASYVSGTAGLLIGNPLDVIKVRLQAGDSPTSPTPAVPLPRIYQFSGARSLIRGTAAPILSSGALNSILFVSYNRTTDFLKTRGDAKAGLGTTWVAGAIGGLATWVVSTPTEIVKCRTQISSSASASNSWAIMRGIMKTEGIRGLYFGGVVTALRDSIGYGFYFWSYELSSRFMGSRMKDRGMDSAGQEAAKVLLCGGLAGIVTWASVFPLDVIKTRVQTQVLGTGVTLDGTQHRRLGAMEIAKNAYKREGSHVFFRGLLVCSVRAFFVNAAQWAVYELLMRELGPKKDSAPAAEVLL